MTLKSHWISQLVSGRGQSFQWIDRLNDRIWFLLPRLLAVKPGRGRHSFLGSCPDSFRDSFSMIRVSSYLGSFKYRPLRIKDGRPAVLNKLRGNYAHWIAPAKQNHFPTYSPQFYQQSSCKTFPVNVKLKWENIKKRERERERLLGCGVIQSRRSDDVTYLPANSSSSFSLSLSLSLSPSLPLSLHFPLLRPYPAGHDSIQLNSDWIQACEAICIDWRQFN